MSLSKPAMLEVVLIENILEQGGKKGSIGLG